MNAHPVTDEQLALFADGDTDDVMVRDHVLTCVACAERLKTYSNTVESLREPDPDLAEIDLVASVQHGIAMESYQPSTRRWVWAVPAMAAAAAFAIALWPKQPEFRRKGGLTSSVGIQAYRATPQGPQSLDKSMHSNDGLVFTYSNDVSQPFGYLMVFAVDAKGQAYWYYPAYEDTESDPVSIAITQGLSVQLPDKVTHELSSGRLGIYSLFSREPLKVSQVEQAVEAMASQPNFDPFSVHFPWGDAEYRLLEAVVK